MPRQRIVRHDLKRSRGIHRANAYVATEARQEFVVQFQSQSYYLTIGLMQTTRYGSDAICIEPLASAGTHTRDADIVEVVQAFTATVHATAVRYIQTVAERDFT